MATTKFNKPLGTEISTLNGNIMANTFDVSNKDVYTGNLLAAPYGVRRYQQNGSTNVPEANTSGYIITLYRNANVSVVISVNDNAKVHVNAKLSGTWTGWKQL